jgi:molecular chaperone GrpE (heat shock protein)
MLMRHKWQVNAMVEAVITLLQSWIDHIYTIRLRYLVRREKAVRYDQLSDNIVGLRQVIDTQDRVLEDLMQQLSARDTEIATLREEYARLVADQALRTAASNKSDRLAFFARVKPLAIQLPTIRAAMESGAELSTQNVLDVLAPFEEILCELGFEPIGRAGEICVYDPQRHKAVGQAAQAMTTEQPVRVRYVGYSYEGEVVEKAEVARIAKSEPVS